MAVLHFFLRKDFTRTKKNQKAPKSTKKHKNAFEQEQKNANKRIKIKNAPKNI